MSCKLLKSNIGYLFATVLLSVNTELRKELLDDNLMQ